MHMRAHGRTASVSRVGARLCLVEGLDEVVAIVVAIVGDVVASVVVFQLAIVAKVATILRIRVH